MTPEGAYALEADWLIACDGAGSPIRAMMGLDFVGRVFEDNFLIADVVMDADFPTERWFWFDPPFNPGQSALLHKQPDGVWRIDLQLGWNIDREREKTARARHPAPEGDARRGHQVRAGMGVDLHVPVPAHGEVPPRSRAVRRRFRASGIALRRARRQFRLPGHRQSDLEAEARSRGPRAGEPARHLRRRAHSRGRREHSRIRRARPTSSRRNPRRAGAFATPRSISRPASISRGRSSIPAVCPRPASTTARRSTAPTIPRCRAARGPARRRSTRRLARVGCSTGSAGAFN